MNSRFAWLALAMLLSATIAGFGLLYNWRLNLGDSFPAYSSMRADALGTRALYDSLQELHEIAVSRRYEPLADLAPFPLRTIVLAGCDHRGWTKLDPAEFAAVDRAVRAGSRIIIAMQAFHDPEQASALTDAKETPTAEEKSEKSPSKKSSAKSAPSNSPAESMVNVAERWGFKIDARWLIDGAKRQAEAPAALPAEVPWGSDVFFHLLPGAPWHVLYRRGGEPVMIERSLGRGSIVLMGDSFPVSNEALQQHRAPALLTWLIGSSVVVEFDENHLGLSDDRGVAALARQYGLAGALLAFFIAALLFVWNRTALFIPPAIEAEEVALSYQQTAGLEALLRRAVATRDLAEMSLTEWRRTARPADIARVDAALVSLPKNTAPLAIYNTIVRTLRRR